jgi:hypothetical protein
MKTMLAIIIMATLVGCVGLPMVEEISPGTFRASAASSGSAYSIAAQAAMEHCRKRSKYLQVTDVDVGHPGIMWPVRVSSTATLTFVCKDSPPG